MSTSVLSAGTIKQTHHLPIVAVDNMDQRDVRDKSSTLSRAEGVPVAKRITSFDSVCTSLSEELTKGMTKTTQVAAPSTVGVVSESLDGKQRIQTEELVERAGTIPRQQSMAAHTSAYIQPNGMRFLFTCLSPRSSSGRRDILGWNLDGMQPLLRDASASASCGKQMVWNLGYLPQTCTTTPHGKTPPVQLQPVGRHGAFGGHRAPETLHSGDMRQGSQTNARSGMPVLETLVLREETLWDAAAGTMLPGGADGHHRHSGSSSSSSSGGCGDASQDLGWMGSPLEALEIGSRTALCGETYGVRPLAAVCLPDCGGKPVWRLITVAVEDSLAGVLSRVFRACSKPPALREVLHDILKECRTLFLEASAGHDGADVEAVLGIEGAANLIATGHAKWLDLVQATSPEAIAMSSTSCSSAGEPRRMWTLSRSSEGGSTGFSFSLTSPKSPMGRHLSPSGSMGTNIFKPVSPSATSPTLLGSSALHGAADSASACSNTSASSGMRAGVVALCSIQDPSCGQEVACSNSPLGSGRGSISSSPSSQGRSPAVEGSHRPAVTEFVATAIGSGGPALRHKPSLSSELVREDCAEGSGVGEDEGTRAGAGGPQSATSGPAAAQWGRTQSMHCLRERSRSSEEPSTQGELAEVAVTVKDDSCTAMEASTPGAGKMTKRRSEDLTESLPHVSGWWNSHGGPRHAHSSSAGSVDRAKATRNHARQLSGPLVTHKQAGHGPLPPLDSKCRQGKQQSSAARTRTPPPAMSRASGSRGGARISADDGAAAAETSSACRSGLLFHPGVVHTAAQRLLSSALKLPQKLRKKSEPTPFVSPSAPVLLMQSDCERGSGHSDLHHLEGAPPRVTSKAATRRAASPVPVRRSDSNARAPWV